MVSSNLKERFEEVTKKLVVPLSSIGIKPNHVTFLGLFTGLVTGWLYVTYAFHPLRLVYAGLLVLLSGFLDAVDGVLARNTDQVTSFGGFLDSISDRYSDLIMISGVTIGGLSDTITGFAALIGSLMVSYSRARGEAGGIKMSGVGLAERAERMIFLAICSIISYFWIDALKWGILVLAIVTNLTVIQRILYYKKKVEKG